MPRSGEGEAGGEPGARDVERAESGAPREQRSQRIVGSREPEDARLVQEGGEAVARWRRVTAGLREPGHEVRLRLSRHLVGRIVRSRAGKVKKAKRDPAAGGRAAPPPGPGGGEEGGQAGEGGLAMGGRGARPG